MKPGSVRPTSALRCGLKRASAEIGRRLYEAGRSLATGESNIGWDRRTGLLSHDRWFNEASRRFRRSGRFCVIFIDVDRFKSVNDNFGHAAGDQLLREISGVLRASVRDGDLVGRFGGDEFEVLLHGDAESAAMVSERVRGGVAGLEMFSAQRQVVRVTVSVGVGVPTPGLSMSLADVFNAADQALNDAKRAGRNAVEVRLAPLTNKAVAQVVVGRD